MYKVHDSQTNRELALKILSQGTSHARATLAREFKALSKLQHPNLIRVFDFGIIPPNTPYFTMEWIDGLTLKDFFRRIENLILVDKILWQVLSALGYLHGNGILHGDIKPENIMISAESADPIRVKLMDFGLASTFEQKKRVTSGTPRFLAPEILRYGAPRSPSTDLYALGISMIESIADTVAPMSSEIGTAFFDSAYDGIHNRLRASGIKSPSSLSSFILDLCKPDPSERLEQAETGLRNLEIFSPGILPHQRKQLDSVFIGRTDEMQRIDSFLRPGYGDKKVLIIQGPTGIGKKTIVERAVRIAQLRRFVVINLAGSLPSDVLFERFIETLTSYMGDSQGKHFSSRYAELTKQHPAMPKKAELHRDSGRALVIYNLIVQSLHEVSQERPVLLAAPDVHRHSEDLFHFVLHLIKQIDFLGSRIKLIITLNTDTALPRKIRELYGSISSASLSTLLELGPFRQEELRELLIEIFGQQLLSDSEMRDLLTKTRGIPLIVVAFIQQLLVSGIIQFENDRWTLDRRRYKQSQIPENIDSTFGLALRDLSENEQALLQSVAVYGRSIRSKELGGLTSSISGGPKRTIESLIRRMILQYDRDGAVSFSHPLYMQYILRDTPYGTKKRLNRTIAEYMVSRGSRDYHKIARHYIEAEDLNKATEFGLRAADKLSSSYMLYDALRLLLDLRDIAIKQKNTSMLPDILIRLGPLEHQTGSPNDALNTFSTLYKSTTSTKEKILHLRQMATIYRLSLGNRTRSKTILRKALRYASDAKDLRSLAEIHYQLGCYLARTNIAHFEKAAELSAGLDTSLRMKSLAHLLYRYKISGNRMRMLQIQGEIERNMGKIDAETKKEILLHLSSVHFYSADYRKARYYLEKKISIERTQDDVFGMIYSLISLGGYCFTEGSYYDMITTLKEAYNMARTYNVLASALTILANLSLAYRNLADYGQAMCMVRLAEAIMKEEAIHQTSSYNLIKPTELFLLLGQATEKEFRTYAGRARQTALEVENNISLGHYNMSFSRYHFNKLRMSDALKFAREALRLFRKAQDRDDVALALIQIAAIEIAQNRPVEASSSLDEAISTYEQIHCEYLKPFLMLGRGMLARSRTSEEAKSILTEGLRTSKKMGTREITWQIQRELALCYEDRGELNKALSCYRDAVETIKQITESIDDEQLKISYLDVPFRKRVFDEIKELKKKTQRAQ